MNNTITIEALLYALRELARRAGVDSGFYQQWEVEHRPTEIVVRPLEGMPCRIRFLRVIHDISELRPPFSIARADWMAPPSPELKEWIPNLLIPFAHSQECGPLFQRTAPNEITCSLDVLASVLLVLSRFEETLPGKVDVHGRFPASRSIAVQQNFCERPVVDELGLAFQQALQILMPRWTPLPRELRVKITHDIDESGVPFDVRTAVSQLLHYRDMRAATRDWIGLLFGIRPSALECVLKIAKLSKQHGFNSAVYWKSSDRSRFDSGYDPRRSPVADVIRALAAEGTENGFHAGYQTFMSVETLEKEINVLREVVGPRPLGGRQHFLRWSPQTWSHWEQCGLKYDSSVGFPEHIGFRAGTCHPYRPWLLDQNRQCNLLEVPLLVMDRTLTAYMGLSKKQITEVVAGCIARCELVGGVFTLLWHNTSLLDPVFGDSYGRILESLSGRKSFDCFAAETEASADVPSKVALFYS